MKPLLDRVLRAVRNVEIRPEEAEEAAARVLSKLTEEYNKVVPHPAMVNRITSCEDFQSLIPAYLSGSLTSARAMLFEDHTRECVACRKAVEAARKPDSLLRGNVVERARDKARTYRHAARWAVAAGLLLMAGLSQRNAIRDFLWPIDVHAIAQAVDGNLFMVSDTDTHTITAGTRIDRDRLVRTGKESRAVLQLADGSQIEVQERSELSLDRTDDGVKIRLGRGSVVVTAAKQRSGHLYVVTNDLTVSVTGTKFSVNAGLKGSRVSVVEGEVHVQNGAMAQALQAGQQFASSPVLSAAPLTATDLRYTSNLVNLVPANTVVFASLPNLREAVDEAYEALKQHVREAPSPGTWWPSEDVINRVRQVGAYLGPEIIIAVPLKDGVKDQAPVLIAETFEPQALKAAIQGLPESGLRFPFVVDNGLFVVSASPKTIEEVLAFRRQASSNPFFSTALYQRISTAYREGVGWFIAADLQRLLPARPVTMELGVADAQQLVIEQKSGKDGPSYRAVLGFNQARRGMMGWLAEPAPMGALEFVSSNAYGVAAIAMKDPSLIVEDVFAFLQRNTPQAIRNIEDFQNQHRIDIRHDLAAPLGGEFLFAVDGPILPVPAWKIVVEVYDAARLQNTIQWAVSEMNREAAAKQQPGVSLSSETADGRTFYTVTFPGAPYRVHYTFWRGYMLIAPDRTLLVEAMQYRDAGGSLARSDNFLSQLPADGRDYVSGFIYQNLSLNLPQNRVTSSTPLLICLYGEPNRIVLSSKAVIGTNISNIAGLGGLIEQIRVR